MRELTMFLTARLDEDEKVARRSTPGPWTTRNLGRHDQSAVVRKGGRADEVIGSTGSSRGAADAQHIARHDPARVLREVETKRRIVATFTELDAHPNRLTYAFAQQQWVTLRAVIAALALPYSDHPGYQPDWAPEGTTT